MQTTPQELLPYGFGEAQLEEAKKEPYASRD